MDLRELELSNLDNIKIVNFPKNIDLGIISTNENTAVVIYFIDRIEDVDSFVKLSETITFPKNNTTILMYKKGRKDGVSLESIFYPFMVKKYSKFRLKLPVLATLEGNIGALIMSKKE